MSAYFLFDNLEVRDPEKLEAYARSVGPIVAEYGGRYVVITGTTELVEGSSAPTSPVMIEFPSVEHARSWYQSEEYRPFKALRLSAVRSNAVLIEGL